MPAPRTSAPRPPRPRRRRRGAGPRPARALAVAALAVAALVGACSSEDDGPDAPSAAPGTGPVGSAPAPERADLVEAVPGPCPLVRPAEVAAATGVAEHRVVVEADGTDPDVPRCRLRAGDVEVRIELVEAPATTASTSAPSGWDPAGGPVPTLADGSAPSGAELVESVDPTGRWEAWGGITVGGTAVIVRVTGGEAPVDGGQPGAATWDEGRTSAIAGQLLRDVAGRA